MVKYSCPVCTEKITIVKPKKGKTIECPVCGVQLKLNRVGSKIVIIAEGTTIDEGEPIEGLDDDMDSDI